MTQSHHSHHPLPHGDCCLGHTQEEGKQGHNLYVTPTGFSNVTAFRKAGALENACLTILAAALRDGDREQVSLLA